MSAVLAHPARRCARQTCARVVRLALAAERAHGLPGGLLVAVAGAESGWRPSVMGWRRGRGRRGCDVGVAQIHVPDCLPHLVRLIRPLGENLRAGAYLLMRSRERCAAPAPPAACRRCPAALYNSGSATWCGRVQAIRRALLAPQEVPGA